MPAHGKRRALGQHFLKDQALCERLVDQGLDLAQQFGCTSLIEIGPGRGALTLPLLERLSTRAGCVKNLRLFERDRELIELWQTRSRDTACPFPFEVIGGDFLEAPESSWLGQPPVAVLSNLPYSAGTAILTRLARHRDAIPVMVLMFQAEVAKRLRAEPDTSAWGSLSIWIQNRWDVKHLVTVPPGAFRPPPEVQSEVVILTRRENLRIPSTESPKIDERFEQLLKAAFAHRRKMLRSGLAGHADLKKALERAGIDGTLRAEALDWDQWNQWMEALLS